MTNGNNIITIACRYSTAMIELGEKYDLLDAIENDLLNIQATLKSSTDLVAFLEHPTIPLGDKKDVIETIFKNSISEYTLNLLRLLLDRNRIFIFSALVNHYVDALNKKRNLVIAKVITAVEIDEETKQRVKSKLENALQQNIKIETDIDSGIIAGMVVKIGDRIIDGSIKKRLENMKKQLEG